MATITVKIKSQKLPSFFTLNENWATLRLIKSLLNFIIKNIAGIRLTDKKLTWRYID